MIYCKLQGQCKFKMSNLCTSQEIGSGKIKPCKTDDDRKVVTKAIAKQPMPVNNEIGRVVPIKEQPQKSPPKPTKKEVDKKENIPPPAPVLQKAVKPPPIPPVVKSASQKAATPPKKAAVPEKKDDPKKKIVTPKPEPVAKKKLEPVKESPKEDKPFQPHVDPKKIGTRKRVLKPVKIEEKKTSSFDVCDKDTKKIFNIPFFTDIANSVFLKANGDIDVFNKMLLQTIEDELTALEHRQELLRCKISVDCDD